MVTCSGLRPKIFATAPRSVVGNWLPFQIAALSAFSSTTQLSGSIDACARYGNSYVASMRFAAEASASSAFPSLRMPIPGLPAASRNVAMISAVPSVFAFDSSHSTVRASRPCLAAQKCWPSTATPVGICTTSTTPATAFAFVASNDFTVAPNRGACATTAVSIPGNFTSCVKMAVPPLFALASTRGVLLSLPM